jgi:hypothetical protein
MLFGQILSLEIKKLKKMYWDRTNGTTCVNSGVGGTNVGVRLTSENYTFS